MILKITSFLVLGIVIAILIYLGTFEIYRQHLLYDVSVYYQRALYFFDHGNLSDVTNEYMPLASLFFLFFSPVFFWNTSLDSFENAFVFGNGLLIALLGYLIYKQRGCNALFFFSAILLAAGPIVLYRFEMLVILTMILALLRFQKGDLIGSGVFLALGTLTKLYPLLLLPYILILTFYKSGLKKIGYYLGVFLLTLCSGILFYFLITQTSIKELRFSLDFHKDKPLGLESMLGGFTHFVNYLQTGNAAPIIARHNTWGVDDANLLLPMPILTYLWIIPVIIFYLWVFFSKQKRASFLFVIAFLTCFFVFSKLFTPQYWLWVLFLLPFIKFHKSVRVWSLVIFATLASGIIQFIYPLHYFDFVAYFYYQNKYFEYLFWIYLVAICYMLITAIIAVLLITKQKDKE